MNLSSSSRDIFHLHRAYLNHLGSAFPRQRPRDRLPPTSPQLHQPLPVVHHKRLHWPEEILARGSQTRYIGRTRVIGESTTRPGSRTVMNRRNCLLRGQIHGGHSQHNLGRPELVHDPTQKRRIDRRW
jgi:hypothetical protein